MPFLDASGRSEEFSPRPGVFFVTLPEGGELFEKTSETGWRQVPVRPDGLIRCAFYNTSYRIEGPPGGQYTFSNRRSRYPMTRMNDLITRLNQTVDELLSEISSAFPTEMDEWPPGAALLYEKLSDFYGVSTDLTEQVLKEMSQK